MQQVLITIKEGQPTEDMIVPFDKFLGTIGFNEYNKQLDDYPNPDSNT